MNEIKIRVNFKDGTIVKKGINLVTGDYALTKLVFDYDTEYERYVLKMKKPNGDLLLVTDIHDEFVLAEEVEGVMQSLFSAEGRYPYEIVAYDNGRLTSACDCLVVRKEEITIGDVVVTPYLPVFDNLMHEVENINILAVKEGRIATIEVTDRYGVVTRVELTDGIDGTDGEDGVDGTTFIPSVSEEGIISWSNDDGKPNPQSRNIKGQRGERGIQGESGNGIASVEKIGTSGLTDTYRITFTDSTNFDFDVVNGRDGVDGETPIANVVKNGNTATITITDTNGTTTASVSDGTDGRNGTDGEDGFSPIASVTKVGKVATISVTDKNGTTTASVTDGEDGASNWNEISGKPDTFPPSSHTHDDRYYTESEIDTQLTSVKEIINIDNGITAEIRAKVTANHKVFLEYGDYIYSPVYYGGSLPDYYFSFACDENIGYALYIDWNNLAIAEEYANEYALKSSLTSHTGNTSVHHSVLSDPDNNIYKIDGSYINATNDYNGDNISTTYAKKTELNSKISTSAKGSANGVAELDSNGKVPSSQLPSYVDDVLSYNSTSNFPATGEDGKIYIAKDTNKTYRWSGTAYVEISPSLALGETSSTAYRGDRGATAYNHSQSGTSSGHHTIGHSPDYASKIDDTFIAAKYDINQDEITTTYQKASTLESDVSAKGFTKNSGTITGITMNGSSKGTSGVVNLGTVITDISGKVDKVSGKGLSTNDYDNTEKQKVTDCNNAKHTHSNINTLNAITGVDTSFSSAGSNLATESAIATWVANRDGLFQPKNKLVLNDTEYTLRIQSTDAGASGYITFVTE